MSGLDVALPALGVLAVAGLLRYGEATGDARMKWRFKPVASLLFVLTAVNQGVASDYDRWIVLGLVLSLCGDVFLISKARKWFLAGLIAFLLGHLAFIAGFRQIAPISALPGGATALVVAASTALFLYFRPRLGAMLWPALAYIVVITLMLIFAWALFAARGEPERAWLVAIGATLFYASDITVARERFIPGTGFLNRAIGLPLYYAAQFLLAFSVGR